MDDIKMRVSGVEKSFPGVKALSNIDFAVRKGTVHALCGENGAGKSTLMKIIMGIYKADRGQIFIDEKPVEIVAIAGKCCESGDLIGTEFNLPKANLGDIVAVLSTGAYNYSMASNYNRNFIPAAVLVKDGKAEYIVKPQTYEDLVRNDVIPDRLR